MRLQAAELSPVVLRFDELPEGTTQVDFAVNAEDLELSDVLFTFPEPVQIFLEVHRCIQTFTIQGRVLVLIEGECARCLVSVSQPLEISVHLLLQRKQASEEELEAVEDEEFEILDPGVREVDLKEFIREEVLLELPQRTYCREDCKGLCAQCGHDLNQGPCSCEKETVDPRWAAFDKVKFS